MNYELCEHGKRIGLDDCETCSVVGLKSQLRRMLEERNEARSKLGEQSKLLEAIHDDLLLRAKIGREKEMVVELSNSLWLRLCAAIDDGDPDFSCCPFHREGGSSEACCNYLEGKEPPT